MSPPQADSHVTLYNRLPLMPDAYAILRRELKSDPSISDADLLLPVLEDQDVRALFCDGSSGEKAGAFFGIWIVHRHFALEFGERMVATDNISQPSPINSTQIPERWDAVGNVIEYMQVETDTAPSQRAPSATFLKAFQDLMFNKFGVSGLGLCCVPCELPPGFAYRETVDEKTRAQIVEILPRDEVFANSGPVYRSSWSITNSGGPSDPPVFGCVCGCTPCSIGPCRNPWGFPYGDPCNSY